MAGIHLGGLATIPIAVAPLANQLVTLSLTFHEAYSEFSPSLLDLVAACTALRHLTLDGLYVVSYRDGSDITASHSPPSYHLTSLALLHSCGSLSRTDLGWLMGRSADSLTVAQFGGDLPSNDALEAINALAPSLVEAAFELDAYKVEVFELIAVVGVAAPTTVNSVKLMIGREDEDEGELGNWLDEAMAGFSAEVRDKIVTAVDEYKYL